MKAVALALGLCVAGTAGAQERRQDPSDFGWPAVEMTAKPWTRWWWPGGAVDRENLTRQLERFAEAGIGGVEITPIYGARGYEDRYIDFLTPKYMEMLGHVGREAERLGLGVDMATGTGWPFGGPWVTEAESSAGIVARDGRLGGEPTGMLVKRAAPGGEGFVVDPYSPEALRRYLEPFDRAFAEFPRNLIRGQFHDSFEYSGAGWTERLPEVFLDMHGYDIHQFAGELVGEEEMDPETLGRIKSDYRATLSRLHLDFILAWAEWSRERGFVVRNQSHGAPANLLDLYGAVDIPETEIFGSTPFPIPGLRRDPAAVRHDQDLPEPLVSRMASSGSHVTGRQLTSCETATWLRDHWKVALSHVKPELDRVLLDGINHVFYHGTVYSPGDVPWPGWLFYASTQFNPNNTWWRDFRALNEYVARVQSILQAGRPDNDILLYWPVYDLWDDPEGLEKQLTVHRVGFLVDEPVGRLAKALDAAGYAFDYISDDQLMQTRAEDGRLVTPGNHYRTLVVPPARRMPLNTMRRIMDLAGNGATVIFADLPEDVPGYGRLEKRRREFRELVDGLAFRGETPGVETLRTDRGEILRGDVFAALRLKEVTREPVADTGVGFIRRESGRGRDYFFANLSAEALDGWVTLGVPVDSAILLDPLDGSVGVAATRRGADGRTQVYLQIEPGASFVLRTLTRGPAPGDAWTYLLSSGDAVPVTGEWTIEFVEGGPVLPPRIQTGRLRSWTELGGPEAERFGGTARYRIEFEMPERQAVDDWVLVLGEVRESARVRLNGREVATAWSIPFKVRVGGYLRAGGNVLELEVTNTAANRIRDLDRRGVRWKIMREINFVDIRYRPFDASGWEVETSGLLGPVALIPMRRLEP